MRRALALALALASSSAEGALAGDSAAAGSPQAAQRLQAGTEFLRQNKSAEAIKEFKAADQASVNACAPCQLGLAKAYNGAGDTKSALKSLNAVLRSTDDPKILSVAWNERGSALVDSAKGDEKKLAEAEAAFGKAVELNGSVTAQFNRGFTLLRLGRDDEGIALLHDFLQAHPDSPNAREAQDLVSNPLRARKRLLPNLDLVTLTGERFSIDELRGKVVLVDVWGTWCEPCRMGVPGLRSLYRRFVNAPFLLIGIADDPDRAKLETFIEENQITWPQVPDGDRTITAPLGIAAYPTYLLLAPDGEIVYSATGWSPQDERELARRVTTAVTAAAKSAKSSG
jgi:tetratricopeptide (TPR) repeat protein